MNCDQTIKSHRGLQDVRDLEGVGIADVTAAESNPCGQERATADSDTLVNSAEHGRQDMRAACSVATKSRREEQGRARYLHSVVGVEKTGNNNSLRRMR